MLLLLLLSVLGVYKHLSIVWFVFLLPCAFARDVGLVALDVLGSSSRCGIADRRLGKVLGSGSLVLIG